MSALDRLAEAYGIELTYISELGERRVIGDDAKRALLAAMGVDPEAIAGDEAVDTSAFRPASPSDPVHACYVPAWLDDARCWGVSAQINGLASQRNLGIGDFEDVARLAELLAQHGADFLGLSPVHALFSAAPSRISPYSPSSRRFLNPLYIAVDQIHGLSASFDPASKETIAAAPVVDPAAVSRVKLAALRAAYDLNPSLPNFGAFRAAGGEALERFALFEALSAEFAASGAGAGWHGWPEAFRSPSTPEVAAWHAAHAHEVGFHAWLQWTASRQLAEAQQRALAAGMRIGLYLDLAVGTAPDGADTWTDPALTVPGARVGAPPDMFHRAGQDWGLAPMSPRTLLERKLAPFEDDLAALMTYAGAIRIDHAMGLERLYWIAEGHGAANGGYVRYPGGAMLDRLAATSTRFRSLVIGEDLGTVPAGFRDTMRTRAIQSYRVLFFERLQSGEFAPPEAYPDSALACLSTHDLATIRGWWQGTDIADRHACGHLTDADRVSALETRGNERRQLVTALADAGLLPEVLEPAARGAERLPDEMPDALVAAAHAFVARTPSKLVAIQLEDLAGAEHQANVPGTNDEQPNWRRKLEVSLDDLAATALFAATIEAVARERPRLAARPYMAQQVPRAEQQSSDQ